MLPFDSPINSLPLEIECVGTIARYGSLTVNEALMVDRISTDLFSHAEGFNSELGLSLLNWHVKTVLATILIQSRSKPQWTLKQSQELLGESLDAVVELFLSERDRPIKQQGKKSDKPVDWADLYCRLKLLYPTEERLNQQNFGNCPIGLIEQYLETAREVEIERLSNEAQAVANLGVWTAAANGAKQTPQTRWFNVFEAVQFARESARSFPPEFAQSFLNLHKKGKVPFWVEEFVDLEIIKASAGTIADG